MLIARLYNHYREQKVFAQREIVSKITIEEKIDSFWVAKMEIPITPGLDTGVKIELYEVGNKEDQLIFRGIVYEIKPVRQRWDMLEITVRWEESIFQKRKTLRKHTFTALPLSTIIKKLIDPYNSEFNEDWGFEIQKDEILTLEIEQWDDYADIFDEICKQKELFWRVVDGVIFFRKNGEDLRSTQLLEYDGCSANPGNIIAIELVGTSSGGNVALIEDSKWRITVDKSQYSWLLTGVVSKQVRKGDDSEKAKQFAKEQARPQRKYQIQVANSSIIANLWDRIKVEVVNTNSFYDYSGEAIVQSKTTSYSNASKVVVYGIQEFLVSPFTAENRVENVEKSIKLLRQRKGGGETPLPQVDLSWYATSSAVNQAIQSQNTKIEKKADSSFVQWVAQTAQTALNTANEAKQTAEGKANKVHTHTKSQISDFPTSMPASDVHEWAKKNKKPDYAWEELLNKPETFTPSTHKHKATDIENIGEVVTQAAVKKALGEVSSDQDGYLTNGDYNKIFPKNGETRGNPLDYEKMTINTMGADRLAFLNPEQVLVETSTDWTNWSEYALADNKKRNLFNGLNGSNDEIQVGKDMQIRVTLDSWINNKSERYVTLEKLYLRTTTSGDNISVKIEKANVGAPDKWILVSDYSGGASNRPGNIVVQHPSILFGCYNNQQTNNWRKVRITIKVVNPQTKFAKYKRWLWGIKRFGMSVYTAPNTMMKYGSLFAWDNEQNAIFPGLVKSSSTPRSQEDLVNKKYVDDLDIPTVPAWAKQENKPEYNWTEIKNKPDKFTPSDHNHNQVYHTKEEIAQLLSGLPNVPENMLTAGNLNNRVREISGWIVVPGNGSGSASIYLRHPNGRMYEFFSDGNGAFGVRDKTNNRDVFRITPNETIFYKELNANNLKIKNLADPNNNKDAANKQYVDKKITEVNTALQKLGQTQQQILTKAEWKALTQKDPNKIYFVKGVGIYVGAEKIISSDAPLWGVLA